MTDEPRPSIDGHEWPLAAHSRFVRAGGLRWHVQILGNGPPMLLIHGTGASCHSWEGLAAELRCRFTLVIVDLPGHGFTDCLPRTGMTLPSLARLLGELLEALGLSPRVVVGHSAGAAIAVRMTLDRCLAPPDLIVSINGAMLPWRGVARWLFPQMARALAAGGPAAHFMSRLAGQTGAVERMLKGTGRPPPPRSTNFYRLLLQRQSHVQAALDMMAAWDLEALDSDLPGLSVPLLLIACGEDTAVPADVAFAVRDRVSTASVHYVRNLGHLAHEESPQSIAELIASRWSSMTGRAENGISIGNGGAA